MCSMPELHNTICAMISPFFLAVVMLSQTMGEVVAVTSDDFRVKGLEAIEPAFATFRGEMYAGLLSIDEHPTNKAKDEGGGKLMFWLFEPHAPTVDDSLVIWFNGGPGCSSFHAGLFFETGPVTTPHRPAGSFGVAEDARYGHNSYAWTNATAMLYVEQPVGTGFSYGAKPPSDEGGVAKDFYFFLKNFYNVFPQQRSKRLYLVGESYAGMYVPAIAHYIYNQNKQNSKAMIQLAGIALGNGWADVNIQGPMVIDYAWWHGMIDSVTRDAMRTEWEHCSLHGKSEPSPFHPFTVPDECGIMGAVLEASGAGLFDWGSPNTYDVTTWDPYRLLTGQNSTNVRFFNDPRVREALHVPKNAKPWTGCIPGEGRRRRRLMTEDNFQSIAAGHRLLGQGEKLLLDDDKPISMIPYLVELLDEAEIPILVYNGDRDMSTCVQGTETLLDNMEWSGSKEWADPGAYRRGLWMVDGRVAGYAKAVRGLQFVVVSNSGHLVPYNQPVFALDLVTRLLRVETFCDVDLPVVFKAQAAKVKSVPNDVHSSGWAGLKWAIFGYIVGIGSVIAYWALRGKRRYDLLGDVDVERR